MRYSTSLSLAIFAFLLAACAGSIQHAKGIQYKTDSASMNISVACVERISRMPESNALAIKLKSGDCEEEFNQFSKSNEGQMLSAYFDGNQLDAPAKIVSQMHSPVVQPVKSTKQATSIMKYYSINK